MIRFVLQLVMGVVLCVASYANATDIVLPADQELAAKRIHELCSRLEPPPKPSYAEAHEAFKRRLGDYYARYQTALYETWKQSVSPERYEKLRATADKMVEDGIEELKGSPDRAKQRCREAIAGLDDPEVEARIRRKVEEFESQRR